MEVGLYFASEVIRRLGGGRIWFESAEGKGSSLSLQLEGVDERLDQGEVADG